MTLKVQSTTQQISIRSIRIGLGQRFQTSVQLHSSSPKQTPRGGNKSIPNFLASEIPSTPKNARTSHQPLRPQVLIYWHNKRGPGAGDYSLESD